MEHVQPQVVFKSIEIAVFVQMLMAMFDAKGGDEAVDRLADGYSFSTQGPIILRGM